MSLTISLNFPTGRYLAATPDHVLDEWPPHPARLALGLIDVLHKSGNSPEARSALEWLFAQAVPEVIIPAADQLDRQRMDGFFVPQNPSVAKDVKHPRKPRSFPTIYLNSEIETIHFHYPDATPSEACFKILGVLIRGLPRFGHSSSLVVARLHQDPPPSGDGWEHWLPDADNLSGSHLRVPYSSLLTAAEDAYDAKGRVAEREALIKVAAKGAKASKVLSPKASPRGRHDPPAHWQAYLTKVPKELPATVWQRRILILARTSGPTPTLSETWQIAELFHKTLLDRWSRDTGRSPVPSWLSGHGDVSSPGRRNPATENHLAFFPVANVGHNHYPDGRLLGFGIAFPKPQTAGIDSSQLKLDWQQAMAALFDQNGTLELALANGHTRMNLAPLALGECRQTLQPARWTGPAARWATVTPLVFDRHPKPSFRQNPEQWQESCRAIVAESCQRIGLPVPIDIQVSPYSPIPGVPPSPSFPAPAARPSRPQRVHYHAIIEFSEPVVGPVLIGAGRFRGYGMFMPVPSSATRQFS